ncbi:MAG: hypothetical protein ACI9HA_001484 [Dinoroseobacter sp.]|jgi:hypothetical protein
MSSSTVIHGSCLCGSVRFEIDRAEGPFEIRHCNRCRKLSGGPGSGLHRHLYGTNSLSGACLPVPVLFKMW